MKLCRVLLIAVVCVLGTVALLAGSADAANYYVATNGSNSNSGTLDRPFLTIQQAANVAQPGDNVFVRGGTYRETVTMAHSGTSSAPITFQPYSGEQVTVSGLDKVGSNWSTYSGSIYSATVPGGVSQVFVGGRMMTEARWPNNGYNNPLHAAFSSIGPASTIYPTPAVSTLNDPNLGNPSNGFWTGASIGMAAGSEWTFTGPTRVISQSGNNLNFDAGATDVLGPAYTPTAGNPYYLYRSLAALDAPKEWHYDSANSRLYLQAPGGANPNSQAIEIRKRQLGFDVGSQSYINVTGFRLQAAGVNIAGNHNTIDNVQILHPTPFVDGDGYHPPAGVQIDGNYNTVTHSEIGYSWGSGMMLRGANNTINNNIIHDVDWSGQFGGFVKIDDQGANTGGNNSVTNNTMYNAGRDGVTVCNSAANTQIQHNDISRYGFLTRDLGGIYTVSATAPGSVIAYNRVHDNHVNNLSPMNMGIYLDYDTTGFTVHNNLVSNVKYGITLNAPGTDLNVYNNTLWGVDAAMTTMVAPGIELTNVKTYNNLSNQGPWYGNDIQKNRAQTADQFTNSAAGDYTLTANNTFAGKRAVNYGMTDATHPTDPYLGSAPDAGAFESGVTPWTAGANWKAWTAGNQTAAALAAAMYVTQSGTRVNTGSLMVGNTTGTSANNRSFLKFDLSGIVSTTVASAVLRIYENTLPTSDMGSVTLNRVTSAWTNANVSYNQSVDTVAAITGFYDASNLDLYTDIDIAAWVQGWLNDSSTNYGLRLSGSEGVVGTAKYFDGFYGVTAPQLLVTIAWPGDANLDGMVDFADLGMLLTNYNHAGNWTTGDFNHDGQVDFADLGILLTNYNRSFTSNVLPAYDGLDADAIRALSLAGVTVVPEPGTFGLLAIGLLAYALRKRGR
jgi:hypothetical protein